MINNRVKFNLILESLVPEYVREEYPLVLEFLKEYYKSIENPGQTLDLLQNIDKYVQIDNITNLIDNTKLVTDINFFDTEIYVESTQGFPKYNGLLQIDSEVIFYESKVEFEKVENINIIIPTNSNTVYPIDVIGSISNYENNLLRIKNENNTIIKTVKIDSIGSGLSLVLSEIPFVSNESYDKTYSCEIIGSKFIGCKRGFSGVTSYTSINAIDKLTFSESESNDHLSNSSVKNLSILFLKEFFKKLKYQIAPGFENLDFFGELNESTFVKNIKQFYAAKGTDCSFELLFRALFGEDVEIIKPRDYLIIPSDAQYRVFRTLIVESISGDPRKLVNKTLKQDKIGNINAAKGIVSKVEKIEKDGEIYYIVSLDNTKENSYDSVVGSFSIHPETKVTFESQINSTYIDVDSTIGFPESGELLIEYENGTSDLVTYESKTSTQFLQCNGITQNIPLNTEVKLNAFAYCKVGSEVISVRITGVLSDLDLIDNSYYNKIGDKIEIKTLGLELDDVRSNNWFFNIPVSYNVSSVSILDNNENQKDYEVVLFDEHILKIGDPITITSSLGQKYSGLVISFINEKSITIRIKNLLDPALDYILNKNISKVESLNYKNLNQYSSNVQNVYVDKNKEIYVNSQSLPNYLYEPLTINDNSISFSGSYENSEEINIGPHNFYTGDSVIYKPGEGTNKLNIEKGIYFVKRVNNTTIKLVRSRNNIYTSTDNKSNFLKLTGNINNNKLEFTKFNLSNLNTKSLEPQNILRKITPDFEKSDTNTLPGNTGILVNGVEILNYKSKDQIFYGEIKSIIPSSQGNGYDVINPPTLMINDPIGFGATAYCTVNGSLERIDIIDPGFDYIEVPKIQITGGNGSGAEAIAELVNYNYSINFDISGINTSINTIGFSTYHRLRTGEKVKYSPLNDTGISGLSTNSSYYVGYIDDLNIKLYKSLNDSITGINTLSITNTGGKYHKLILETYKKKIGSIKIVNKGKNYQNKKRTCYSVGINTYSDTILIKDHGYLNGEIITYDSTEESPVGLSSGSNYYVTKINDDEFKLSSVGITSLGIQPLFYYKTKQYIKLGSQGTGKHIFNYPKIEVTIFGKVGTTQSYQADIQPIFSGKIESVFVENGGNSYGSNEILNYVKQPEIELLTGTDAQLEPIISDGKIVDIIIKNPGKNYYSTPRLEIRGSGFGCILTPIVKYGVLYEVKIISSGDGYGNETKIDVIPAGIGAKFEASIQSWRINLVERIFRNNSIVEDDGVIYEGKGKNSSLEYTHLYAPRKLRSSIFGTRTVNGKVIYSQDLELIDGKESNSVSHSPIIGWAYDGNPIYGPYGYSSITGGSIKQMISGYEIVIKNNRPSFDLYPLGIFVEDYEFLNSGDLDKCNGRYCVTPEFPKGTYAYFSTFNTFVESREGSPFNRYKKPTFPYLIGNNYKSNPIKFNFSINSTLNNFDLNKEKWLRNTKPYSLSKKNSYYNFIENPEKNNKDISIVEEINSGKIDSVGIITGGNDYKIGDKLIVDNTNTGGYGFNALVSSIKGSKLLKLESYTEVNNIEILSIDSKLIAFSTSVHNLINNDVVTLNSKYDFNVSGSIKLTQNNLVLTSSIGSTSITGIITYFNVSGNLNYPTIKENDIYQIGQEKVKILSIDKNSSRIKVLRNIDNIVGVLTAISGSILTEQSKKFEIQLNSSSGLSTESLFDINREIYFVPNETLGIGTTSGVGITSTLYFSNPGVGATFISIPTKTLYIPNHNLNTGDQLIYSSNGGSPITVSLNGINGFSLQENSKVYVSRITSDLIGISTNNNNLLYFLNFGSGINHSFKTNKNVFSGKVFKTIITSTTNDKHNLSVNDEINLKVESKSTQILKVKYSKNHRRLLINPIDFLSGDVNIDNSTINLQNHNLRSGQKVIYTSSSPSEGLKDNEIYYVINVSNNLIGISSSLYDSIKLSPSFINIQTSSSGTISPINPRIDITKNNQVIFDLSDSSLSFKNNSFNYPAFKFTLYSDSQFTNEFETSEKNSIFNIQRSGVVGIDSDAKLIINSTENIENNIFYNLTPINLKINDKENLEIISDTDVIDANKISFNESLLNGEHTIVGISSTTFSFNLIGYPEQSNYDLSNSKLSYTTNSNNCSGEIDEIKIVSGGLNYKSLPSVTSVSSDNGYGAVLKLNSNSIGSILKTKKLDIGFNYSCDFTIRPTSIQPLLFEVENISIIDNIEVLLPGKNYTVSPKLILIDKKNNNIVEDLVLDYNFKNRKVTILKNTSGISDYLPNIVSINNTNGIDIRNITYNNITKDVTIELNPGFSREIDFPFNIGDKIFIENVSVGIKTTGKGYNSSNYNYELFEIKSVDKNIGGSGGLITYNLSEYLLNEEYPGLFDSFNSSGKVIPETYLPKFKVNTKKREFYINEFIESGSSKGRVQSIDLSNNILKISSKDKFSSGDIIKGLSSNTVARITNVVEFNSIYNVDSNLIRDGKWERETGFLNNNVQRIHDNNYYQYFSYDLKSKIDYEKWNPYVSNLNHTSGFKKFGSLVIDSKSNYTGISTEQNQSDFVGVSHIDQIIDLNCYSDFDLVKENNINIDNQIVTDEIIFNSKLIQDYIESIGNRVLIIDDLSPSFNNRPRSDVYSIVDSFDLKNVYKKYFIFIRDKVFIDYKQFLIVSLIQNNQSGYLNQYGRVENSSDLGYFDFRISSSLGNLLFFPKKYESGSYDVNYISFDINNSIIGVGETSFGNAARLFTTQTDIIDGISQKIVGIDSSCKGAKVLVQIKSYDDDNYYEFNELTLTHNDDEVSILEYGQFNTSLLSENSGVGIATYNSYLLDNELVIDIQTNVGLGKSFAVNTSVISIGNSIVDQVNSFNFEEGIIGSGFTSVGSSVSPTPIIVSNLPTNCHSSYIVSLVEDLTNNQSRISEIITLKDEIQGNLLISEYGIIKTDKDIGLYDTDDYNLTFTPNPNINVRITYLQVSLGRFDDFYSNSILNLNNSTITSGYGHYYGTNLDIRKEFNLTYNGNPIFERVFDGSDSKNVNLNNNSVLLPNHFFITGEEIEYRYNNSDTSTEYAIGITSTFISGIGFTDKLPTTLYVVKDNDIKIRVAASASQSLQTIPEVLDFSNLGIGTEHRFISKKRNEKSLISIDNLIQSPVVSTSTTSGLTTSMNRIVSYVSVDNTKNLLGGDLIKINDEIMMIRSVDFPIKNNLLVDRGLLGTKVSSHNQESILYKVKGNYNIVDNKIYFSEAPFGKIPIVNSNSRYDEIDYTGLQISSRFNGRVFLRSGISNSNSDTYKNNIIIDDISSNFDAINSVFEFKYENSSITGISTDNAIVLVNNILQYPELNYVLNENTGITTITFENSVSSQYDSRVINLPKGGIILSVASSEGFGYQPLVAAGGTAIVSPSGSIQSISIGNSGSGYRSGIQTTVNVGVVKTDTTNYELEIVGIASIVNGNVVNVSIINPGTGYTYTNPPSVIFDKPYSYENIPLIYSSESENIGVGTNAKIDIVVGQSSNVINFELKDLGYGYKKGDILTVNVGGQTGIPTNTTSSNFKSFKITVDSIFNDNFSAWTVGNLQILDSFENLFDGIRKRFPISINENPISIVTKKGSNIDIKSTLLVFVNNILQVPGEGYIFNGGSIIEFTEAPKSEDKCSIIFYGGTDGIDSINVDILETVKIGDELTINSDDPLYQEKYRIAELITNVDTVKTNFYSDEGIDKQSNLFRPVMWCKQTEDKIINGNYVGKNRTHYEPYIYPTTNIIQNVGFNTNIIFVESVKSFFDSEKEYFHNGVNEKPQNKIIIISQDSIVSASATVVVSSSGTISDIVISDGGVGYTTNPTVSISNPIGIGISGRAKAYTSIINGSVTSVSISTCGFGYDPINPPEILFESPSSRYEIIDDVLYDGDFGIITGISTISVGVASTGIVFDFFIPKDSFLRNNDIVKVGIATTGISGIQTGYYFVVKNSNVGNGLTSLDSVGNVISIGNSFIDNIYQVVSVSIAKTSVPGIGLTSVAKVVVNVSSYNNLSGLGFSSFYGEYSWGRISAPTRKNPNEFLSYGYTGITTSPVIQRFNRLKYIGYSTT